MDLILFIAATAGALAFCKTFVTWYHPDYSDPWKVIEDMRRRGPIGAPFHITYWVHLASPFLLLWTLALIPALLRRPRPPLTRLMRRPGAAACVALVVATTASLIIWGLLWLPSLFGYQIVARSLSSPIYPIAYRAYMFALVAIGHSIAVAWSILAASRRWKAEPTWTDRLGRVFGTVWIVLLPLNHWSAFLIQ